MKPRLAWVLGDPAGIGPEICLRALREPSPLAECVPVLFGDASVLRRLSRAGYPANEARVISIAEFNACSQITALTWVDFATPRSGQN